MRRFAVFRTSCLFATALLTACGDITGVRWNGTDTGGYTGALRIRNTTATPIWDVYIVRCSSQDWGPNQLGRYDAIAAYDSRRFTGLPDGCWDVKVVRSDGTEATRYDLYLNAGTTTEWAPAGWVFGRTATPGDTLPAAQVRQAAAP